MGFFNQPIHLFSFTFLLFWSSKHESAIRLGRGYILRTNDSPFLILLLNKKKFLNGGSNVICINQTNIKMVCLRSGSVRIDCLWSFFTYSNQLYVFNIFLLLFIKKCTDDQRSHLPASIMINSFYYTSTIHFFEQQRNNDK